MKNIITRIVLALLGGRIRLITLNELEEERIITEMSRIEKITDYWEMNKQGGYQLYAKSGDRKYLGLVELSETMIALINKLNDEEEEPRNEKGFSSSLEE